MKETVIALILISLMTSGIVCVLPANAQYQGDIILNADGSIIPSTAPIQVTGNVYTLTSDVTGRITVNRDNMVLEGNGHTITYSGSGPGNVYALSLPDASNVTVKDFVIVEGWYGIVVGGNSNIIANNTVTQTGNGIYSLDSPTAGIGIYGNSNIISGNNLTNNYVGIDFFEGENNIIVGNMIENNSLGLMIWGVSNNTIYHNNFVNNSAQAETASVDSANPVNSWDVGYPRGGNYWSDYQKRYPNAAEIDNSGIGDTPYVMKTWYRQLDSQNQDRYPLLEPFTSATYLLQTTPPKIGVLSPTNLTYTESNVSLVFTVDKHVAWAFYSLDGEQNVTISGNTTLTGVSSGSHSITVYANDTYGNIAASETVTFTITQPFPIVTAAVVVGSVAAVAVVAAAVLTCRSRRRGARNA